MPTWHTIHDSIPWHINTTCHTLPYKMAYHSGVPRVSSARGPMLGSAPPPPPPCLVNPASAPGEKIDKQKKKKSLQHEKDTQGDRGPWKLGAHSIMLWVIQHCNEVTLLICLGLIFFLKFAPTSWAGAPSKACARGPWPPLPPPLGTPLAYQYNTKCSVHYRPPPWDPLIRTTFGE